MAFSAPVKKRARSATGRLRAKPKTVIDTAVPSVPSSSVGRRPYASAARPHTPTKRCPAWLAAAAPAFAATGAARVDDADGLGDKGNLNKFRDWHELLYSMRSLGAHAPWIRNVYIVTSGPSQVPDWLNASHPRVRVVHHAQLFDDPATQLPTFNSYAIESVLHRIPGLSNRFLYLNQDFLLGRAAELADWMLAAPPAAAGAPPPP